MKSDTSQGALRNRWLRALSHDAFQAMLPYLSLREVYPRSRGFRSQLTKFTDHVVFPIDCQVALTDSASYEELTWAGEADGLLSSSFLAAVGTTELVPRTRGHAYLIPRVVVTRHPYLYSLIDAERCRFVERALAWQLARAKRSVRQNVAAYLLTFDVWGTAFSLTQQEIATALGTRRESVAEIMKNFERAGYVEHSRAYITIKWRAALEAIRDGSTPTPLVETAATAAPMMEAVHGNP